MMTYQLIKKLIASGKTYGLQDKADILFTCGRLTDEQYTEIVGLLTTDKDGE